MAHIIIERYIEANYSKWLSHTTRKCVRFGINPYNANDLLQEVLFVVFKKKDEQEVLKMITETAHSYSMLDIFISRTRKNILMNTQKHCRIVARITVDIDISSCNIAPSDDNINYDVYEKQQWLASVINRMQIEERTRDILTQKIVYNHRLNSLPGSTTRVSQLYIKGIQQLKKEVQ